MAYGLILPSLVFLLAIVVYPLSVGLLEGFRYHNRLQPWLTAFNGVDNFVQAWNDNQVWLALRTSFVMVVGIVASATGWVWSPGCCSITSSASAASTVR